MAFERTFRQGDRVYRALVESYRDEEGRVRQRVVKWYGKHKTPPPDPAPLSGVDFFAIGAKLMDGSLTPRDAVDLVRRIGKRDVDVSELEAIGIRYEFVQKKLQLYLFPKGYDWRVWSGPRNAPRAKAASRKPAPKRGTASSPPKAKPG